jgi:hypothetical protein
MLRIDYDNGVEKITRKELAFRPVGNFVLIRPLKMKYDTVEQTVPVEQTRLVNQNNDENIGMGAKGEYEFKTEKRKVNRAQQLAEVLSIGTLDADKTPFKPGDIIVYPLNGVLPFELIKGTKLIYAHNILGIWEQLLG